MPNMQKMPIVHTMPFLTATQCQICTQCHLCSTFGIRWLHIWHCIGAQLALGRFKICMAKGGRESARPSYGPAATVSQQCICCPICGHHFTHWTHPDISLLFRAGGRRLKNFRFSRNSIAARVFFLPACCGLNFDATDLPNSSFEPLYPKLFRGTPEVDLVSTVWPPDLPKVRWCRYFSPRNGCF